MLDQSNPEAVTVSLPCEVGRHLACRGAVQTLTLGLDHSPIPCACPVCAHEDEPDQEEDLDRLADEIAELELEASLEAAHFGAEL